MANPNGLVDVIPDYLSKIIRDIAFDEGFTTGIYSVSFEDGLKFADGFSAAMHKAVITEGDRTLPLLCKLPPLNETRRKEFRSMALFKREVFVYKHLLPEFYLFQKERRMRDDVGFFNAPKCYHTHYDEDKDEAAIVMADLREHGYSTPSKYKPVDLNHAKLLVTKLGHFHAISLAMKEQKPKLFEKYRELSDVMSENIALIEKMCSGLSLSLDNAIQLLGPSEQMQKDKLEQLKPRLLEEIYSCGHSEKGEPANVVLHGDCWLNNVMFSYRKAIPDHAIILDWQLTRYGSPVVDLVYFLFICTDEKFRSEEYDNMLRIYHNALSENLKRLGGDPKKQFPFTALLRHLKYFGKIGFLLSLITAPVLYLTSDEIPDLDKAAQTYKETNEMKFEGKVSEATAKKYEAKMGGIIRDVFRFGYL